MKPTSLFVHIPSRRIKLNLSGIYAMPPLGIAMLAASLRAAGYPVDLLDSPGLGLDDRGIADRLLEKDYDHIGLSANVFAIDNAIRFARLIKEKKPQTLVSIGGPCTVFEPEQIFSYTDAIDLVVRGEGEEIVVDIARKLEQGKEPKDIPGTVWHNGGESIKNPAAAPLELNELPRPALDMLPMKAYRMHPPFGAFPPALILETSRGCPFRCTFCTLPKNIRMRSAEAVVDDVLWLINQYGAREIHFVDPTFTFNRKRTVDICRGLIEKAPKIKWSCKTRCDLVDRELLELMARSGCYTISYGVESFTQSVLDALKKDVTVEQTETALAETRRAGIRTLAYMLIGAPGETDESVDKMIRIVRRLKPDFALYGELLPDPCSEVTDEAIERGIFSEKKMLDYYLGGETKLLEDQSMLGFPAGQIDIWISKASSAFYARPGYILQRLLDVRSFNDFLNLFRGAWGLLRDKFGGGETVG